MENNRNKHLDLENAHIFFRNFKGAESKFNRAGNRNFCVEIPNTATVNGKTLAETLMDDGWNIKRFRSTDEDEEPRFYVQVAVSFDHMPPKVVLVTGKKMVALDEDTIGELDYAEIDTVDLVIRPYYWEVNGKSGAKAYLKTMYVTVAEDKFAHKYEQLDDFDSEDIPF